jgi:hypothetical protein
MPNLVPPGSHRRSLERQQTFAVHESQAQQAAGFAKPPIGKIEYNVAFEMSSPCCPETQVLQPPLQRPWIPHP